MCGRGGGGQTTGLTFPKSGCILSEGALARTGVNTLGKNCCLSSLQGMTGVWTAHSNTT